MHLHQVASTQIGSVTKKAVLARPHLDHCPDSRKGGKRKWEKMKLAPPQHFHERLDIDQGQGKDFAVFTAIVLTAMDSDLVRSV